MHLAAVGADRALAEQRIVCWRCFHLVDDGLAVLGVSERFNGLQVVQCGSIVAGLIEGRVFAVVGGSKGFCEGAVAIVEIPIPGIGEGQPLRRLQTERVNVGNEDQQARHFLATGHDAKFAGRLDGVDGVAAGVSETDDLGFGALSLQHERREVRRREGRAHFAENLAAVGNHDGFRVALEGVSECVVSGDEEPAVSAVLDDGAAGAIGQHPGVVGPMDGVGRARLACQVRTCRADVEIGLVQVARDFVDRKRDRRRADIDDHVDAVRLGPLARDG